MFFVLLVSIFIFQRFIQSTVKKAANENRIPADVVNGIIVLIRFGSAIGVLYSAVYFLEFGESASISLSLFLGSIVSFASMYTIQNFVSGIYIVITRPFKVNDFVKIGNSEGVVTEISLNYTSILNFEGILELIPNKRILNSTFINYDQKIKDPNKKNQRLEWTEKIKSTLNEEEVTRYSFIWGAPLIDYKEIKSKLNTVCEKYESIFGYKPEYFPFTINHRLEFCFVLSSNQPITILKYKTNFLDDIVELFH